MKLGADDVKWRWIGPDGQEQSGSKGILSAQLAGTLPPKTLVWRAGWAEWVPASKVAELAHALPAGSAEAPLEPSKSADPKLVPARPDAAPVGGFSTVVPAPRNAAKFVRPQISPPRITLPSEQKTTRAVEPEKPPSSFGVLGGKRPEPALPPQSAPRPPTSPSPFGPERGTARYEGARPPMPTLGDEAPPATATLRPPGAVPPPPRSANATTGPILDPLVIERFAKIRAEDTPVPAAPSKSTGDAEEIASEDVDMTLDDGAPTQRKELPPPSPVKSSEAAPSVLAPALVHAPPPPPSRAAPPPPPSRAASPPPPLAAAAPASAPLESTLSSEHSPESMEAAHQVLNAVAPLPSPPLPPRSAAPRPSAAVSFGDEQPSAVEPRASVHRLKLTVYVLGGVSALLALIALGLMLGKRGEESALEAPAASASAGAVEPAKGCAIVAHPARLAAAVDRSVPPLLAAEAVNGRLALGFAESNKKAIGLMVAPHSLDAEQVFEKVSERSLKSVVPLVGSGAPTFAVDSDGGPLKFARTVDAKLPFSVGLADGAVARVVSSSPEPIWPTTTAAMTEPRVGSLPGGHAVTFRDGGLEGKVMLGWLTADGGKRSELVPVGGPRFVGTPFVAASDTGFVLAFAGRDSNQDPWRVELAAGEVWKTEARRTTFLAPPGGVGGGQIAPSVAALPGGRWLLQWTEGKTGSYQVRTQLLNASLEPVGDPLLVSPKGASSGQGSLFVAGRHALSLYIQTIGGHDELWATTLECR